MSQKILWDEDEAVILHDALLQVLSGKLLRKDAVALVSKELRMRAIYRGFAIDDIFRNENGISLQMSVMECAHTGGVRGLKQHGVPKLFQDVVSLYERDRSTYEKRVIEAKTAIGSANARQERFFEWVAEEIPSEQIPALYTELRTICADINRLCAQKGTLKGSLFETADLNLVGQVLHAVPSDEKVYYTGQHEMSKLYSVLYLYYQFLQEHNGGVRASIASTDDQPLSARKPSHAENGRQVTSEGRQGTPPPPDKPHPHVSAELLSAANSILTSNFVNGMRKNAVTAKKKFRKAYLDLTGDEFPETIDIDELASIVSFECAGKFYVVSESNKQRLQKIVLTAVSVGNRVIFYEELYQQHMDFMTKAGIFSTDLLKVVLKQIFPDMCYQRAFFSPTNNDSLEKDIMDCFEDSPMLTYAEIKERLLYADLSQIRLTCSRSDKLVWAKEETYALTDQIQLSQSDIEHSMDTISQDIENQGFSVCQRIVVSESIEQNPYVPEAAVREAMYVKHLAPIYERNRSIITSLGASFSPSMVMVEYCKGLREATLSELQSYEEALTNRSRHFLSAAYDTMIRVDREHFVSLDAIEFNIDGVDDTLSLFVQDNIVPLGSVKSFTSFPEVDGHPWNLFLLDSFCRHRSKQFRTMGGPAKSKPVGAIFPIQMQFDSYDALLAQVAAESGLALRRDILGDFFTKNAYTLRRIETSGIINQAQEIRIQEGIADV